MKRAYIYTTNHFHSVGVTDLVMLLRNGARDCGYDAVTSDRVEPGEWNILIEGFDNPAHRKIIRDEWRLGTRFICVCTEALNGRYFNDGLVDGHFHYSAQGYWQKRYEGFKEMLPFIDELWILSESQIEPYRAAFPDKPISLLPHGWVSGMAQVEHRPESEKDIDFFFSGALTPYRLAILENLHARYRVAYSPPGGADYLRMDLLARTRVCLSMPLSPRNHAPSVSRMHFHIQNSNFVLQHRYEHSCALDTYVLQAPAENYVDWAVAALKVENRREIARASYERFRLEMPMTRWLAPLLERNEPGSGAGVAGNSSTALRGNSVAQCVTP
jgi:hypothetical protein